MYIMHIKITLHIQVIVYCKKCSYPEFKQSILYSKKYVAATSNRNIHYALHDLGYVHFWIGLICTEADAFGGHLYYDYFYRPWGVTPPPLPPPGSATWKEGLHLLPVVTRIRPR